MRKCYFFKAKKLIIAVIFFTFAIELFFFAVLPSSRLKATEETVKYRLSYEGKDNLNIRVLLRFNAIKGEKFLLQSRAEVEPFIHNLELDVEPQVDYSLEKRSNHAWVVIPKKSGLIGITYQVRNAPENGSKTLSDVSGRAFLCWGGEMFLVPMRTCKEGSSREYLVNPWESFEIEVEAKNDIRFILPWRICDDGKTYKVNGYEELTENFIALGKFNVNNVSSRGLIIKVSFGEGNTFSRSSMKRICSDLRKIFFRIQNILGEKKGDKNLSMIVLADKRSSWFLSSRNSIVLGLNGDILKDRNAYIASRAGFDLWNRFQLVAKSRSGARWFSEGISVYFPYKISVSCGLSSPDCAKREFASIYERVIKSREISIKEAEQRNEVKVLQDRGAILCALLDRRLERLGNKSIEWLLRELAAKTKQNKKNEYTLLDIEEICENGTGKSWDRFFAEYLSRSSPPPLSEFLDTGIFKSVSLNEELNLKGSRKSFLFLLIAVLFIFSIPIIFGTYVRRAIKLDVEMPKILPDDLDE